MGCLRYTVPDHSTIRTIGHEMAHGQQRRMRKQTQDMFVFTEQGVHVTHRLRKMAPQRVDLKYNFLI